MHSRVYTHGIKCGSRHEIQSRGFQQLETRPKNIPENLCSPRIHNGGPICVPNEPPNKQIHKLETGSHKHRNECFSTALGFLLVPMLLQMSIQNPLLIPQIPNLLLNPGKESLPLVQNRTLHLAARLVSGQECKQRAYQRGLPLSSLKLGEREPEAITNQPG